ncbi:uncharacterized protein LOC129590643 [Paramacrobiotus metropolitanus]|uniref:uncharacterized protein LOC129590643 n=1 Tax=Paramacrobiotus metropolitanus TaxID=2943436 RepID=UPI0024457E4C|nr:uncharacterized protein LOC129590643 [Paramacrobiotus metropolitanus]
MLCRCFRRKLTKFFFFPRYMYILMDCYLLRGVTSGWRLRTTAGKSSAMQLNRKYALEFGQMFPPAAEQAVGAGYVAAREHPRLLQLIRLRHSSVTHSGQRPTMQPRAVVIFGGARLRKSQITAFPAETQFAPAPAVMPAACMIRPAPRFVCRGLPLALLTEEDSRAH